MAVDQAVRGLGAQLVHDREAVGEIYVALGSTVRSYLQNLVGHDDADDIVQRVFYEVWRHNGLLRGLATQPSGRMRLVLRPV